MLDTLLENSAGKKLYLRQNEGSYGCSWPDKSIPIPAPVTFGLTDNVTAKTGDFGSQLEIYTLVGKLGGITQAKSFRTMFNRTIPSNPPIWLSIGTENNANKKVPRGRPVTLTANAGAATANPNRVTCAVADLYQFGPGDRVTVYDGSSPTGETDTVAAGTTPYADGYITLTNNLTGDYETTDAAKVIRWQQVGCMKAKYSWDTALLPDGGEVMVMVNIGVMRVIAF